MAPSYKVTAVTVVSLSGLVTGVLVIVGWEFHIPGLQTVFPGFASMKFNDAICFILTGAALLLTQFQLKKYNTAVFLVISSTIIVAGVLSVSEYVFHFNTALDQLFITDTTSIANKYPFPGRMAPGSATCFILFGLSFFGFSTKSRLFHTASQYLLHAVTAVSAMSIVGYFYGLSLFYNPSMVGAMAVHTAVLFFFLSLIASLLHPSLGITPLFTGSLVGNAMARQVILLLVFIVIAFGAFRVESIRYRLFSEQTGISLLVICFIWLGLALIWHTANWLNKFDTQRHDAEEEVKVMNEELEKRVEVRSASLRRLLEKLRESESKFRAAFEHSAMGMALVSLQGQWLKVNKRLCDMVGYREQDLLSMSFNALDYPGEDSLHLEAMNKSVKSDNEPYQVEKRYICKNGAVVWVCINLATVTNKKGGPIYFVSQFEDVTERKKAERHLKNAYKRIKDQVNSIKDIAWKQSHLVRSPLANLKGLVEILQNDPTDKEAISYMQIELERLDNVIIEMAEDACSKGVTKTVVKKRALGSSFKGQKTSSLAEKSIF
jgi:PAS domain S-box-containing protein